MTKKKVNIDSVDYDKQVEYEGSIFDLFSVKYGDELFEGLKSKSERVLILPFDRNEFNQVKRIYINRFYNFIDEETQFKPLLATVDEDEDESLLNTVQRASLEQLGITSDKFDIERMMYLGEIILNDGVNGKLRCYAIDVTSLAKSPKGFVPDVQDEPANKTVEPILFRDVIRGEYNDSLTLSVAMLLLSVLD